MADERRTTRGSRWLLLVGLVVAMPAVAMVALWCLVSRTKPEGTASMFAISPDQVQSIVIYDLDGFAQPSADLRSVPAARLDRELSQAIMRAAAARRGGVVWKGSRLAVVHLESGEARRIAICLHGPAFVVLGQDGHYEVIGEAGANLVERLGKIVSEEFIPQRRLRNQPGSRPAQTSTTEGSEGKDDVHR